MYGRIILLSIMFFWLVVSSPALASDRSCLNIISVENTGDIVISLLRKRHVEIKRVIINGKVGVLSCDLYEGDGYDRNSIQWHLWPAVLDPDGKRGVFFNYNDSSGKSCGMNTNSVEVVFEVNGKTCTVVQDMSGLKD